MNRRDFLKIGTASIVSAGLVGLGARWLEEQNLPKYQAGGSSKPNIVFLVLDTVRAGNMSLLGYDRLTTPNLTRLARKGVSFSRAFSPACWTLQSHASMFTGRLPFELSADYHRPLDKTYPTLAEVLQKAGYQTAGFIANYYYLSPDYGLDRGFQHYESQRLTPGLGFLTTALGHNIKYEWRVLDPLDRNNTFGRKNASMVREDFLQWLDHANTTQPFFSFINFIDAHEPYLPPEKYVARLTDQPWMTHIPNKYNKHKDPQVLDRLRNAYDGTIAFLDEQVGQLYEDLERRGLIDNTLIVITSDHGEQFGEHDLLEHGNSMFLQLLHVPLMILHPALPQSKSIIEPVSLVDIASTLVDMAGLPRDIEFSGKSLLSLIMEENQETGFIRSESSINYGSNRTRALIGDRFHYINYEDGREILFDYSNDPTELDDLSTTPHGKKVLKDLRQVIKLSA